MKDRASYHFLFLYFVFYTEKVYISIYHVLMIMLYTAYKLPQTLSGLLL